jgi:hypothetical protein
VPDAPISRFDLQINGGRHGILVLNTDICRQRRVTQATFDGQNGKRFRSAVRMKLPCGFRVAKRTRKSRSYDLTLSGVGAGTVKVSGRGIRTVTRKLKNASIATVPAQLTAQGRRQLARSGRYTTRVTVTFTPAGGKAKRTTTTLTFRR